MAWGLKKRCTKCKEEKDISSFHKSKIRKTGIASWCKKCTNENVRKWESNNKEKNDKRRRELMLKRKFNISSDDYNSLLMSQGGKCAICGNVNGNSNGVKLAVDHNHATGKIRGILCYSCNTGIGSFKDQPNLLEKAIEYLAVHNE